MRALSLATSLLIVAILCRAGPVLAQELDPDLGEGGEEPRLDFDQISLEQLLQEEIVTTGSKREVTQSASLSTISVITEDQINALPYFYLGDLLSMVPGVDARWGKMQRYYIGARGLGGTSLNARMLLLWDGVPMNDPFTGELTAGHFLPLADVERVEVIRGAASTIYGAGAFSGVVNVLTRNSGRGLDGVRASVLHGSNLTTRVQLAGGKRLSDLRLYGGVEMFKTDGVFPSANRVIGNTDAEFKNDDVTSVSANGAVIYKGLRLSGRYTYGDRGRPGAFATDSTGHIRECNQCHTAESSLGKGVKYPSTDKSCGNCHPSLFDRETQHRGSIAASFHRALGKGFNVSSTAWHNEYRTLYSITAEQPFLEYAPYKPEIKQRGTGGEAYVSHSYKELNSALLGFEGRRYEAASPMIISGQGNAVTQAYVAFYLEDEFRPTKWLSVTGGFRLDYNAEFGAFPSPRGGIVLTPLKRLALKASIARAFRNPSLSELFVYDTRGKYVVEGGDSVQRGSLRPETMLAYEWGGSYSLLARSNFVIRASAVGFFNNADNVIAFRAVSSNRATFFNQGHIHFIGTELEIEAEYKGKPEFKVFANYSYQKNTDSVEDVPYAPAHKANFGLLAKYAGAAMFLRVRYVGPRSDELGVTLPPFTTLDLSAQFGVWGGLTASLWATNLAASGHQESLGIPAAGRNFYVSLGFTR